MFDDDFVIETLHKREICEDRVVSCSRNWDLEFFAFVINEVNKRSKRKWSAEFECCLNFHFGFCHTKVLTIWEMDVNWKFSHFICNFVMKFLVFISIVTHPEASFGFNVKRYWRKNNFPAVKENFGLSALAFEFDCKVRLFCFIIQKQGDFGAVFNCFVRIKSDSNCWMDTWLQNAFRWVHCKSGSIQSHSIDSPFYRVGVRVWNLDVVVERQRFLTFCDDFCLEVDNRGFKIESWLLTNCCNLAKDAFYILLPTSQRKRKNKTFGIVRTLRSVP